MTDKEKNISERTTTTDTAEVQVSGNARIVSKYEGTSPAMSCRVFPENELVALGWSDGTIEVRNTGTFEEVHKFEASDELPITFLSRYKSDDDEKLLLLSSSACGETVMLDIVKGEELWKITEDRQALVNGFNFDYSQFAIGGSDAKINIFDASEQKLVQVLQGSMDPDIMDGHTMRVFSLRFHPTRKYDLISGGWDDTIQFWDVREPFSKRKIRGPHICGDGIEFLDSDRFVTASWTKRNSLQLWDYRNGKLIDSIRPDDLQCFLYCCRYIEPDSILLTGGSHKNMLRVIDMKSFKTLATFTGLPGAVYFAKELPKKGYATSICFCSGKLVYVAEVEV